MRDYRDAKAMALTLRDALKTRSINITHSTALELTAKALGFKDWHVLAARIEADRPAAPRSAPQPAAASPSALHCSFCAKSQYDVSRLIAGPNVFICNECVGLCDDIVVGQDPAGYAETPATLGAKSTEELVVLENSLKSTLTALSAKSSAAYLARLKQRTAAIDRTAVTVGGLLAERGHVPGPA